MAPLSHPSARPILKFFKGHDRALVALSGGVDSGVLLALAARALGPANVVAATAVSPALAAVERESARRVAGFVGVGYLEIDTQEMKNPRYRANLGDRCFHCRVEMFDVFRRVATERGIDLVVYGAIVDDLQDDRPGMRAAAERGVAAPLLEAGLGKGEVRAIARQLGLAVSEKPAAACLGSRIPVGTEVTAERLAQVERAEAVLAELGFLQFRVRHHGAVARLELDAAGRDRIADDDLRRRVVRRIRSTGFERVSVDPEGYRGGSLRVVTPAGSAGRASREGPRRSG